MGAPELRVLVMSFGLVIWKDVLHGTPPMVSDGDKTVEFRLTLLLRSDGRVFFCNQEVRASRSGDQFFVL